MTADGNSVAGAGGGRTAFACDAVVVMAADGDVRAPGAAVTVALCGHWEHEPPCPLAAHHTAVERAGDEVLLRVLFAAEPAAEAEVRERIAAALSAGEFEGSATRWQLTSLRAAPVRPEEAGHAARLAAG